MRLGLFVLLAACYAPRLQAGSPCDQGPCPAGLVCSPASLTCETTAVDAAAVTDTRILIDGCIPTPEICGNGIDEDCDGSDPECPPNDGPSGAIDVSAGGTFTSNVANATDDAPNLGCNGDGGRDVFFQITVTAAEVIYFDTFGSDFETELRVYPGKTCDAIAGMPICNHDQCGGQQSQFAAQLGGTSCIVVDQKAGETHGALTLHVIRAGRAAMRLQGGTQTNTGNTCSGTNVTDPPTACVDGNTGPKDLAYYFTSCPQEIVKVDASTCSDPTQTHFDTVLYLAPAGGATLACNDDDDTCVARTERPDKADGSILTDVPAMGPNLFLLTVDAYGDATTCGGYQLVTTLH